MSNDERYLKLLEENNKLQERLKQQQEFQKMILMKMEQVQKLQKDFIDDKDKNYKQIEKTQSDLKIHQSQTKTMEQTNDYQKKQQQDTVNYNDKHMIMSVASTRGSVKENKNVEKKQEVNQEKNMLDKLEEMKNRGSNNQEILDKNKNKQQQTR